MSGWVGRIYLLTELLNCCTHFTEIVKEMNFWQRGGVISALEELRRVIAQFLSEMEETWRAPSFKSQKCILLKNKS